MFTDFFIKRPVFASVCSLLIVLLGIVAYTRLPVQEYPSIDPPVVTVTSVYPGANPEVVETEVTEILEAEINGVDGIKTLSSQSSQSTSTITVQFELDRDLDTAAQDVRDRVGRVRGELPDNVEAPVVSKESGSSSPIIWFALYGENLTTLQLSDYADRVIVDALESVSGVSSVIIGGERRYAMRIWLDARQLAARNLTVLDVEEALRSQNVQIPSGIVEGEFNEYAVQTLGRLQAPEEYQDLVIRSNPDGSQTRLEDVGRAEIGAENYRSFVRFKGQAAVGLGVVKLSDANTLAVANGVKEKMQELSENFPAGMQYQVASDDSEFVAIAIEEVWKSLFLAIALVVLVIFLFLHDWRSTIIPAITIPIALTGAFAIMYFLDFSVNTLTLFALTLATGLVVDDTIVVLENIVRYIEQENYPPFRAASVGVAEVVFAVIATTIVLIAVFAPVGFSGGTTGKLFTEFALTLAGAVVLSSFVALTLAPPLSARLLRRNSKLGGWFFNSLEWGLNRLNAIYQWSLKQLMKLKFVAIVLFVASLVITYFLYNQIPQEFLPTEDRGSIFTIVQGPEGVSINYTDEVMQQVEEIYSEVPEVNSYFTIGGFSGSGGNPVSEGIAFVKLKPWSERTAENESQQTIVNSLFGRFSQISDALVLPINPSSLPGASFSQPVQFVLQGNDLSELAEASGRLANQARQLPELVNVNSNFQLNKPELTVEVNRALAGNLGVSVRDVARTLQILLGGQEITNFNRGNRRFEVVVQAEDRYRNEPDSIGEFYVRASNGDVIPLSSIVTVERTTTPPQINHFSRSRSATIEGSPAPGYSLGDALTALENLAEETLPDSISTTLSGQSLEFREAGQSILFVFGLALAFIFLVLAAQFESYLDPIVILLAVPLSLLGAFGALLLGGLNLNVYSQIGLIMLIGLVTKNSILIVEFANQRRDEGMSATKAAIQAGQVRFRPILMTAFSTIFGLLPLVLASGAGAASRVSLGTAVVGGMIVSTFLSLFIVPVFYVLAEKLQRKLVPSEH
ncbi:efflux RND transporter permease subunit [Oscillatoria salina]|uniref:efflux RND transporter permease subunit n=1 Tax=Oscillatoria salina TaxID=331517 RepID=UPI0013BB16B0|nr:efflux RND transporter permease subunit [Oscillatoria salina]MBZ8178812.1 efflux RND transporter permease subunit [Oscillatoria salina IIICB1]NET88193.1 efflux RND transporter permease subunit [Kamptonema sp. SIO1D9]